MRIEFCFCYLKDYGATPLSPVDNKFNYMPGGVYNPASGIGNALGGGYGNRYPYEGGSVNGPYPGAGAGIGGGFGAGLFPPDIEGKTSVILPLAGAALLGKEKINKKYAN